jgi:hypothetical protein
LRALFGAPRIQKVGIDVDALVSAYLATVPAVVFDPRTDRLGWSERNSDLFPKDEFIVRPSDRGRRAMAPGGH